MDKHFAKTHRVLPLIDIQLGKPQLALVPEQGRVTLTPQPDGIAATEQSKLEWQSGRVGAAGY
ncbi:MAG: hypothetical protein IPH54_11930 [Rhodoferax sp.]|nr:hypothetical protein [Rhodoferax sp.]